MRKPSMMESVAFRVGRNGGVGGDRGIVNSLTEAFWLGKFFHEQGLSSDAELEGISEGGNPTVYVVGDRWAGPFIYWRNPKTGSWEHQELNNPD